MNSAAQPARSGLPRAVKLFGLVSLLNDFASEMIYPLLPAFVTGVLGAGAGALGALDGAAEFAAAGVKWGAGRLADRPGRHPASGDRGEPRAGDRGAGVGHLGGTRRYGAVRGGRRWSAGRPLTASYLCPPLTAGTPRYLLLLPPAHARDTHHPAVAGAR